VAGPNKLDPAAFEDNISGMSSSLILLDHLFTMETTRAICEMARAKYPELELLLSLLFGDVTFFRVGKDDKAKQDRGRVKNNKPS